MPRLSLEELLRVDPEGIIVLLGPPPNAANAPSDAQVLHDYDALEPLTARKNGRISVLKTDAAYANGPRILTLKEQLGREVRACSRPRCPRQHPSPA